MPNTRGGLITDMTANEINDKAFELLRDFSIEPHASHFENVNPAHYYNEVLNGRGDNLYYQWLFCLVKLLNPKQIVELGSAAGISTIIMSLAKANDCKLYSVDIDAKMAWTWMKNDYPNVTKILGDDLNMAIWPGNIDLGKTDLWFIDTLHTGEQLTKEIELYKPYWKTGTVVVLDDIRLPGMFDVWDKLQYDKCENTNPCHYSGFGFFVK
jgi:cephalosporin hydroxylase